MQTETQMTSIFHLVTGTAVAIALSASPASAQKNYDTGGDRYRDQDRPDGAVQRTGLCIRDHRQGPGAYIKMVTIRAALTAARST